MDIASLLTALTAADAGAKESNPFAPLQSASDGIASAFIQNSPKFNTKDNLLGSLLLGLTSGITGNLANTYQDKQSGLARSLLESAFAGNNVVQPEDMPDSVFNPIKNTLSIFNAQEGLDKRKEIRQAELDVAKAIAQQKALLELQKNQNGDGRLSQIANLPQALQDDALKQQAQVEQSGKLNSTIDTYFNQAKDISSGLALIPGTDDANKMSGVQIGLTNMLQGLQGREMNDQARQALQPALPDWNDTKDQIEQKKQLFKQMTNALTPSTPLFSGATPSGQGSEKQFEIRTAPNGQRYKVLLGK